MRAQREAERPAALPRGGGRPETLPGQAGHTATRPARQHCPHGPPPAACPPPPWVGEPRGVNPDSHICSWFESQLLHRQLC